MAPMPSKMRPLPAPSTMIAVLPAASAPRALPSPPISSTQAAATMQRWLRPRLIFRLPRLPPRLIPAADDVKRDAAMLASDVLRPTRVRAAEASARPASLCDVERRIRDSNLPANGHIFRPRYAPGSAPYALTRHQKEPFLSRVLSE